MNQNNLPPELITQIIDLLEVGVGILIGWVAKWLQRKSLTKKTSNQDGNI